MIKLAPYSFSLSVLLNANYADGIDTSWIWDADFEQITDGYSSQGAPLEIARRLFGSLAIRLKRSQKWLH